MDQPQEEFIDLQSSHPAREGEQAVETQLLRTGVHVVAIVTTKPGQRDALLEAFRSNRPNVLAEHGCMEYQATVDSAPVLKFQTEFGRDSFVVIEKWESLAALEAHSTAPHMVAYGARTREMIASRVIHVMTPV
jgi:quinol monooxygenase YgiN